MNCKNSLYDDGTIYDCEMEQDHEGRHKSKKKQW